MRPTPASNSPNRRGRSQNSERESAELCDQTAVGAPDLGPLGEHRREQGGADAQHIAMPESQEAEGFTPLALRTQLLELVVKRLRLTGMLQHEVAQRPRLHLGLEHKFAALDAVGGHRDAKRHAETQQHDDAHSEDAQANEARVAHLRGGLGSLGQQGARLQRREGLGTAEDVGQHTLQPLGQGLRHGSPARDTRPLPTRTGPVQRGAPQQEQSQLCSSGRKCGMDDCPSVLLPEPSTLRKSSAWQGHRPALPAATSPILGHSIHRPRQERTR